MKELVGTLVGAIAIGLFVPLFVWVMNNTQKSGADVGLDWFWAILLIIALLAVMGVWHSIFGVHEPRQHGSAH